MHDTHPDLPLGPLLTEEAARWLKLSGWTLEKHRCSGTGPTYRKIGRRVAYELSELRAWLDRGARRSTAEASPGRSEATQRTPQLRLMTIPRNMGSPPPLPWRRLGSMPIMSA